MKTSFQPILRKDLTKTRHYKAGLGELSMTSIKCRWGGEEFLIICPETDTASFGVASAREGEQVSSLIQRADEALYIAKNSGRNRVELGLNETI